MFAQRQLSAPHMHRMNGMPACARPVVAVRRGCTVPTHATAVAADRFIPKWNQCFDYLRGKKLETVAPEAAARLINSGDWVLIDVRRGDQHAVASPQGAVNVALYQKIDWAAGFDPTKALKTLVYAFNGVEPIEPNPEFNEQVAKLAGGKGIIFACEAGGTMKPSVNFSMGKPSRSLQACYKALAEGGHTKVKHLERGIYGWYQADLPFTGDYTPEIGRSPSAAAEPNQQRSYERRGNDKKE